MSLEIDTFPCYYKIFWYCELHDDAFYTIMFHEEKYNNQNDLHDFVEYPSDQWSDQWSLCYMGDSLSIKNKCDTTYIGYRSYSNEDVLMKDTTKEFNFDRRGGGYEWKFLDHCELIDGNPSIKGDYP